MAGHAGLHGVAGRSPTQEVRLTDHPNGGSEFASSQHGGVGEVARLFLKLGFTAFGGPAAHIALFREEVVVRRRWLSDAHFLDLLGATNLIPGPNSTEMAIHIGYVQAGWRGSVAAGAGFVLPAAAIVLALAVLYVHYGSTPTATWLLYGIKPVIIAVIVRALWGLLRAAVRDGLLAGIGVAVFLLYLAGLNEIVLLFGGGLLVMLARNAARLRRWPGQGYILSALGLPWSLLVPAATSAVPVSLATLFLTFFKIGAVMYGSGYVLLAFLQNDFVERLGWLTSQQLLDAVAVGQFTPGPLFTTATFIGFLVAGTPGAVLATLGMFLPSFVFVWLSNPFIPRLRRSPWLSGLLDGVNVAALGLMAAVTVELVHSALVDGLTVIIALVAAVLLIRLRINATWLIITGAIMGLLRWLVG
ncbi:MAG: chromate efflux transporter [Anaerolineae bacterium]|nr:chromate efflux transporter [Anaerolineae bacterium]